MEKSQSAAPSSGPNDETFNFDDLNSTDDDGDDHLRDAAEIVQKHEQQAAAGEGADINQEAKLRGRGEEAAEQKAAAPRSPSPSALSTTSSASPLIRSNSSSSSISSGSALSSSATGKPRGAYNVALAAKRRAHLAPTSIAVAQLQHNALALDNQKSKKSSPKMPKLQSGNKLAQMASIHYQQQQQQHVRNEYQTHSHTGGGGEPKKMKTKKALGAGGGDNPNTDSTKSFGYKLGKSLVHRASR